MRWIIGTIIAILLLILAVYFILPRLVPGVLKRVSPKVTVTPFPTLNINFPSIAVTPIVTPTPYLTPAISTPTPTLARTPQTGLP
jgi:hypothetical protein